MFFSFILIVALAFIFSLISVQFYRIIFKGEAPFISTNTALVKQILQVLEKSGLKYPAGRTVYELGCGRAIFLRTLGRKDKSNKLIGVENQILPYLISSFLIQGRGRNIKIIKKDFLHIDLSDAGLIYCYLNVTTMRALGVKLKRECLPGTLVISRAFKLPETQPLMRAMAGSDSLFFYKL